MKYIKEIFKRKIVVTAFAIIFVLILLYNSGFIYGRDNRVKVTCVGDSITYGSGVIDTRDTDAYPAQLQTKLGTSHEVSNYGLRNATASFDGDLPYVDSEEYKASLTSNPDIVVLMLGTNDSKTYNWNASNYEQGLRDLVNTYKSLDSQPTVYLMRCPYCYSLDGGDVAEYDIQPVVVSDEIGAIIEDVAFDLDVELIDLYTVTEGQDDLYTDGVHFNKAGYELIADTVEEAITK